MTQSLKKAFFYGRVSSDGQDDSLTIDSQYRETKKAAERNGYTIVKAFREIGTATNDDRSQFQAMVLEAIAPGSGVEAIWFYEQSRFVRNELDFYNYVKVLTDAGVKLCSAREGIFGEDEYSRMFWGIRTLFNATFSRDVARRTRDMQFGAIREGYYISTIPPFGYEKYKVQEGKKEHTKLRPHPEQWDHLLKIWEMALNGNTPLKIAQYLNGIGVLTNMGNEWSDRAVRVILQRPVYVGDTVRGIKQNSKLIPNGETLARGEGAHQAAVTQEQFDRVQGMIAQRTNKVSAPRSHSSPNPLSGLIECGLCGANMVVAKDHGVRRLRCSTKKYKGAGACASKNVPLDLVLTTVVGKLLDHILTVDTLEEQIKAVAQNNQVFLLEQQTKRAELHKSVKRANQQIDNLVKAIENTGGDERIYEQFNKRKAELGQYKSELEELDATMGEHLMFLNEPELIISNALDMRTYLESDDEQTARRFLQSFIQKVTINEKGEGTITYSVPLPSDGPDSEPQTETVRLEKRGSDESCLLGIPMTMMF